MCFITEKQAEEKGVRFNYSLPYVKIYVPVFSRSAEDLALSWGYDLKRLAQEKVQKNEADFVCLVYSKNGRVVLISQNQKVLDWMQEKFHTQCVGKVQFYDCQSLELVEKRLWAFYQKSEL